MKKYALLVLVIALISAVSGNLMSQPSFIGKVGIDLFYKEYQFLRIWWQGALAVFGVLFFFLLVQGLLQRKSGRKAIWVHLVMILLAALGLYLTYYDFHHTTTHRWLKQRFHTGAYLFWAGWMLISLFYIFLNLFKKKSIHPA